MLENRLIKRKHLKHAEELVNKEIAYNQLIKSTSTTKSIIDW